MDNGHKDVLATLAKLRQGALLLTLANGYLCEPPILKKIGREMDRALEALPDQIESLKSEKPGTLDKVETDPLLKQLQQIIRELREAEAETSARCGNGDLGRDLEIGIDDLMSAVCGMGEREKKGASPARPPRKASSPSVYRCLDLVFGLSRKLLLFVLAPFLLIAGLLFGYLFMTMEGEDKVRMQIAGVESQANSLRTTLNAIEMEKGRISQRMESMTRRELQRAEKIELMEMGQELRGVGERQTQVETTLQGIEKEGDLLRAKLKEMEGKSFLARLFRL